jgi:hypothetical protein
MIDYPSKFQNKTLILVYIVVLCELDGILNLSGIVSVWPQKKAPRSPLMLLVVIVVVA